jgi:hypothetical protein
MSPTRSPALAALLALAAHPALAANPGPGEEARIEDNSFLIEVGEVDLVWGAALPLGAGPSAGDRSYFLYLSVEHSI